MVAPHVIGFTVTPGGPAANPPRAVATGADDTGVIVSDDTQAPGLTVADPVVRPGAVVINPTTGPGPEPAPPPSRATGRSTTTAPASWSGCRTTPTHASTSDAAC